MPQYDLDLLIDVAGHQVKVRERVTWTNCQQRPTQVIVFNNHSHYTVPDKDVGLLAKTLELLRLAPSDALDFSTQAPPCTVHKVSLVKGPAEVVPLKFGYWPSNTTALEVVLPEPVGPGQSVTVELEFTLRLPQRQGRWGQWRGVTFLAQWLPVVAVFDSSGWQPVPFVPWHQPFFNEAGVYHATVTLPADQKLGHTGSVAAERMLPDGWRQVEIGHVVARDFSLVCSSRFVESKGQAGPIQIRVLHLPEHAFHGGQMVRIASEAIPLWSKLFGPFPYPEFTVVESYFGWNGNECGGLVLIDERVFGMPHMLVPFIELLLTHEIGHQWFYNVVGTNGYGETWMDEGIISYFTHKLLDQKCGRNNHLLNWPWALQWLPGIQRQDYRNYCLMGCIGRGEATKTVQEMEKFGHLVTLTAMTYDRGGRIVGMIEQRIGEAATIDFMRIIYRKYYFRILRVADFQRELEEYTGRSWQVFFAQWIYGAGMTDWRLEEVDIVPVGGRKGGVLGQWADQLGLDAIVHRQGKAEPVQVTVLLRQTCEINEPTVLGFCLDGSDHYQLRLPVPPGAGVLRLEDHDPPAIIESIGDNCVRVTVTLPCRPTQISVDPDQILLDKEPTNNHWKPRHRFRFTPLYFQLDETDLTNNHDRHNFIFGPWFYGPTWNDPWYTRSPLVGVRAGVYRTQQYSGGAYLAYRTNDRNVVAGVDGLLDHFPFCKTQVGFNVEKRLTSVNEEEGEGNRAVLFARYVLLYGSSMYLPPFEYIEAFASYQDDVLPRPRRLLPGQELFSEQTALGLHYHKFYLTPYWDPEGGLALDATYQAGLPVAGSPDFHRGSLHLSAVKYFPDPLHLLQGHPVLEWLANTRFAGRIFIGGAWPDHGRFFALGGGDLFRGFDIRQRQGSALWLASLEWRVPLWRGLQCDVCDHIAGVRNVYLAAFYDVGAIYHQGRVIGDVAHAVGLGLRVDVAWFSMIERTMLRFDVAQALGQDTATQFWFGITHPF